MTKFMNHDRQEKCNDEGKNTEYLQHYLIPTISERATLRASSSIALTSEISRIGESANESNFIAVAATISTIAENSNSAFINASTAISFAALKTAGNPPPRFPQWRARFIAGKRFSSIGSKFQECSALQSIAAVACVTRWGAPKAYAIGPFIFGGLS